MKMLKLLVVRVSWPSIHRSLTTAVGGASVTSDEKVARGRQISLRREIFDHFGHTEAFAAHCEQANSKLLKASSRGSVGAHCLDDLAAERIFQSVSDHLSVDTPTIELNPGLGLLTRRLLAAGQRKVIAFEPDEYFRTVLSPLQSEYGKDSLTIANGYFLQLWKEGFKDKMDGGSRMKALLPDLEVRPWAADPATQMIGVVFSPKFISYVNSCITFQEGIISFGRPEMFLILPPDIFCHIHYQKLAIKARYSKYVLFNIYFDHDLLCEVDAKAFLPWIRYTPNKLKQIAATGLNPASYYLVRASPKRDLFDVLPLTLLKPLWFFTYQGIWASSTKVIPFLENWIPGCGPTFIACGLDVFTEFRDLNHEETFNVFLKFVARPEFETCLFHQAIDSYLYQSAIAKLGDSTIEEAEDVNDTNQLDVEPVTA